MSKYVPKGIAQQVSAIGDKIPTAVLRIIQRYFTHLENRADIRIDVDYLNRKIARYTKKKSNRSRALTDQFNRFKASLTRNQTGCWHRPTVSLFSTKTGRDTASGQALNFIPKHYWQGLLSPPEGYCYVLLDYSQQEPMIAAFKANCSKLLEKYEKGDIYEYLINKVTNGKLKRVMFKRLMLMRLYGASTKRIAKELYKSESEVKQWLISLKQAIDPVDYYLDGEVFKAKRKGELNSLDWRMIITEETKDLTMRNWPIQAAGADIMRRACFNLDKVNIPVLLTNHDSFLVQLEKDNLDHQLQLANQALTDASAEVLDGFQLKVKVEMQLPSKR